MTFPLGVTSGTYDNTLDMTQATSYNPAYVTATGGTTAGAEAARAPLSHSSIYGMSNNTALKPACYSCVEIFQALLISRRLVAKCSA